MLLSSWVVLLFCFLSACSPSQALPRQLPQRGSQDLKSVAKVSGSMMKFPAVLLALPLRKDFPRSGGRCRAAPDERQRPLALHAADRTSSHKKELLHETVQQPFGKCLRCGCPHSSGRDFRFMPCARRGPCLRCSACVPSRSGACAGWGWAGSP